MGGGDSGTECLPTANGLRGVEAQNIEAVNSLEGKKKGGGSQLQTKNQIRVVA